MPLSLFELTSLLQKHDAHKQDFVVPARAISLYNGNKLVMVRGVEQHNYDVSQVCHEHLSEKLGIPRGYYDRLKDKAPYLLDENVNHWLESKEKDGKKFLVRTYRQVNEAFVEPIKPVARAVLSDKHHMIDNYLVLLETLQAIADSGLADKVEVKDSVITDRRMYVEFVCPDIQVEAPELLKHYRKAITAGTGIISGFLLQNSEVGKGAFHIIPRAVVLCCNNGMIDPGMSLKRIHLGKRLDEGFDFTHVEPVRKANIALIREQIKYAVSHFLTREYVQNLVSKYEQMAGMEIKAPVNKVTEVISERYGWTEQNTERLLMKFIEGGDVRRIGMYNAMTVVAQELEGDSKYEAEASAWDVVKNFELIEAAAMKKILS